MLRPALFPVHRRPVVAESTPWDDHEDDTPDGADNQNFKQLRSYARKQEQRAKELEAQVAVLREEVTKAVFERVGLSEKHATLFAKVHEGEVTADAVVQFATEYELPRKEAAPAPAEGEATPEVTEPVDGQILELQTGEVHEVPKPQGFAPVAASGQSPAGKIITDVAEAEQLLVSNPTEYIRLREAGRIQLPKLPGAGTSGLPGAS